MNQQLHPATEFNRINNLIATIPWDTLLLDCYCSYKPWDGRHNVQCFCCELSEDGRGKWHSQDQSYWVSCDTPVSC